jgi:hypothetical protein
MNKSIKAIVAALTVAVSLSTFSTVSAAAPTTTGQTKNRVINTQQTVKTPVYKTLADNNEIRSVSVNDDDANKTYVVTYHKNTGEVDIQSTDNISKKVTKQSMKIGTQDQLSKKGSKITPNYVIASDSSFLFDYYYTYYDTGLYDVGSSTWNGMSNLQPTSAVLNFKSAVDTCSADEGQALIYGTGTALAAALSVASYICSGGTLTVAACGAGAVAVGLATPAGDYLYLDYKSSENCAVWYNEISLGH